MRRLCKVVVHVDDEWRVRLTGYAQPARGKQASAAAVCGLLRGHIGAEVSVSAGKAGIFLYAATADAAATAADVAREMLAQQGLAADIAVERWDPSGQAWLPSGPEDRPSRTGVQACAWSTGDISRPRVEVGGPAPTL